jgi:hypothetical protein
MGPDHAAPGPAVDDAAPTDRGRNRAPDIPPYKGPAFIRIVRAVHAADTHDAWLNEIARHFGEDAALRWEGWVHQACSHGSSLLDARFGAYYRLRAGDAAEQAA